MISAALCLSDGGLYTYRLGSSGRRTDGCSSPGCRAGRRQPIFLFIAANPSIVLSTRPSHWSMTVCKAIPPRLSRAAGQISTKVTHEPDDLAASPTPRWHTCDSSNGLSTVSNLSMRTGPLLEGTGAPNSMQRWPETRPAPDLPRPSKRPQSRIHNFLGPDRFPFSTPLCVPVSDASMMRPRSPAADARRR
jgi:hypothetical protein